MSINIKNKVVANKLTFKGTRAAIETHTLDHAQLLRRS